MALGVALLVTVVLVSPDPLTAFVVLLFPAVIAAAKIGGLYEADGQRIRKTTVEELPRLVQLGALLVLAIWLGDVLLLSGPAGEDQAILLGVVFVLAAVLPSSTARL